MVLDWSEGRVLEGRRRKEEHVPLGGGGGVGVGGVSVMKTSV